MMFTQKSAISFRNTVGIMPTRIDLMAQADYGSCKREYSASTLKKSSLQMFGATLTKVAIAQRIQICWYS